MSQSRLIDEFLPIEEVNVLAAYEMSFKMISKDVRQALAKLHGIEAKVIPVRTRLNDISYYPARRPSPVASVGVGSPGLRGGALPGA